VSTATDEIQRRLAHLREAFDRSFAEPARPAAAECEDLLTIRVGDDPYAVRLDAIAGVASDWSLTVLPGAPPRLLGVAAFRATVVPVYDLAALLGYHRSAGARWLVHLAGEPPVALAFDGVDGHVRLPRGSTAGVATPDPGDRRAYTTDLVPTPDGIRAVIDIPAVRAAIVAAARSGADAEGDHHGA
jgi:chemotaxis signal transduction protein